MGSLCLSKRGNAFKKTCPPHPAQILCKYSGGGRMLLGAWMVKKENPTLIKKEKEDTAPQESNGPVQAPASQRRIIRRGQK